MCIPNIFFTDTEYTHIGKVELFENGGIKTLCEI